MLSFLARPYKQRVRGSNPCAPTKLRRKVILNLSYWLRKITLCSFFNHYKIWPNDCIISNPFTKVISVSHKPTVGKISDNEMAITVIINAFNVTIEEIVSKMALQSYFLKTPSYCRLVQLKPLVLYLNCCRVG